MSEPESESPRGISGRVVVIGFLVVCFIAAAISVAVTLSGQWAPQPDLEPPPEIGHELVPRR